MSNDDGHAIEDYGELWYPRCETRRRHVIARWVNAAGFRVCKIRCAACGKEREGL